ncbi:exported hypothetical protein [Agrobacterium tumefaciens str. CFBP 5621]|nr:exported hypothetical protein [Agrobacterium tumefaciens str. CFBP 5621]
MMIYGLVIFALAAAIALYFLIGMHPGARRAKRRGALPFSLGLTLCRVESAN